MISATSRPTTPISRYSLLTLWEAHKHSLLKPTSPQATQALVKSHFATDDINTNQKPSVLCLPTNAGGKGIHEIELFVRKYAEQSYSIIDEKVINRVIAGLNLVEEALLTIIHEEPVDWLLPDVKPTRRRILLPTSTSVSFNDEGKITSKRVYWDQASVLKQIGVLPVSLFCKANNSETVLPVQPASTIVARLLEDPALNLGAALDDIVPAPAEDGVPAEESQSYQDSAQTLVRPPRSVATSILPQGNEEEPVPAARTLNKRPSMSSILPTRDEEAPIHSGKRTSFASVRDGNGYPSGEDFRPSTRLHFQPGGKPSNIFSTDPVPVKTAVPIDKRRFETNISFGPTETDPASTSHAANRRNPNWSSVEVDPNAGMTGSLGGGRKHYDAGRTTVAPFAAEEGSENFGANVGGGHGRKHHAEKANQNNDIFGAPTASEGVRTGRRDPNARSVEMDSRPSSRVMRPPGGGTSFSLA
ncbi:hypothetical protein HDV00_009788 [Rhizophlyctis rosea]|nr:hypothetical protein HDV00_009788 [Rhizophlyctis rosea]